MKIQFVISLLLLTSCLNPEARQNRAQIVQSMAQTLSKQFPGVAAKNIDELNSGDILVDVREFSERNISMLPHAISLDEFELKKEAFKKQTIVAYDTLGQRSLEWVSRMRAEGYDAYNLHGGILLWAHHGGEFITPTGKPTKKVHVYSEAWKMLPDGYEAISE